MQERFLATPKYTRFYTRPNCNLIAVHPFSILTCFLIPHNDQNSISSPNCYPWWWADDAGRSNSGSGVDIPLYSWGARSPIICCCCGLIGHRTVQCPNSPPIKIRIHPDDSSLGTNWVLHVSSELIRWWLLQGPCLLSLSSIDGLPLLDCLLC